MAHPLRSWLALVPLASALGCGDPITIAEPLSTRHLLVLEREPAATEADPRVIGSVTLARASGERERIPVLPPEGLGSLYGVAWGLEGDVLVSRSTLHASLLWSEGDEEPWLLHASPHYLEYGSASVAPNGRYLIKHESSNFDSPWATVELFDLLERASIGGHGACESGAFHLLGEGPDFLVVSRDCEDFGTEYFEHTLTHVRPGREHEVLAVHPDQAPKVASVAPRGDHAVVEHDGRWQLHRLHPERDHVVVIDEPLEPWLGSFTWSHDGSMLAYIDGLDWVVRDTTGATRWRDSYVPGDLAWSPVDDRFALVPLHGPSANTIVLVDPVRSELSTLLGGDPIGSVSWSPTGETLLATSTCGSSGSMALDLVDTSTTERVRVTECDVPYERERWAPDGSMLAFQETCGEEQTQVRIVSDRGEPLGQSPCGALSLGTWSPDSDAVSVTQDDHAWVLYASGRMVDLGPGTLGAWRPGPLRE